MIEFWMESWKDNVSFVLVEPQEPGNIGASARAMKNMGFDKLEIVNPPDMGSYEARAFAHSAEDVLESAIVREDLKTAIDDKAFVIGTSRRFGKKRGLMFNIEDSAVRIREIARKNRVAILFGREDKGLSNQEVDQCAFLVSIPTSKKAPSINLSQSVMLMAYELFKAEYRVAPKELKTRKTRMVVQDADEPFVSKAEMDFLLERTSAAMKLIGYYGKKEETLMRNLRHMIGRVGITDWELQLMHGVCSQIEGKLGNSR